ncbi:unnamed protein product, partial [marine sediment metagenome]
DSNADKIVDTEYSKTQSKANPKSKSGNVKKKISGKNTVYAKGQYWDWNTAYKVYNSRKNYEQLKWSDLGETPTMVSKIKTGTVKKKIDRKNTIYAKGQYWDWNTAYKVYNSRKNYDQLKWMDLGEPPKTNPDRTTRMKRLKSATKIFNDGGTEKEVRNAIKDEQGNIYREEIDAVMLKLSSSSNAFNGGVLARLDGKKLKDCPFSKSVQYPDYINWYSGFDATDLAIKLHGKDKVLEYF